MRKIKRFMALLLVCMLLTGCAEDQKPSYAWPENDPTPMPGIDPRTGNTDGGKGQSTSSSDITGGDAKSLSAENTVWNFSHALFSESLTEENPVLSPLSAYLALGMAALGAKEDTLAEFEKVMGADFADISAGLVQSIPDWMTYSDTMKQEPLPLHVAHSAWIDEDMKPLESWLDAVEEIYASEVYQTALSGNAAQQDINQWIEKNTNSLIKNFLSEPLSADTLLALFNTVYFKGEWDKEFEKLATRQDDFLLDTKSGDTVAVEMMNDRSRTEDYIANGRMDGVIMRYLDGNMAMVAVKPTAGQSVRELYESLTWEELNGLLDTAEERTVSLKLPKFAITFDRKLNEDLQNMGIQTAFDAETADFNGIGTATAGQPLYISLVRQKAVVQVDELGTEAAAVTMIAMDECAAMDPENPLEVFFDEPFLYMIMDMESRTPLFIGILDNPSATQQRKQ